MGIESLLGGLAPAELAQRAKANDYSRLTISHKDLRGESITGCSFLDAQLTNCSFSHCYFERCYFRRANFAHVSFTGSRFVECSFEQATFEQCDLSYASYADCSITHKQIARCLPNRQNVLHELARTLRVNAQNRGDKENARLFLREELLASEEHNYKKWREVNDPYYTKYTIAQRISAFFEWTSLKLARWLWGYGESWLAVLRIAGLIIIAFGIAYWKVLRISGLPGDGFSESLLFSLATFTTVSYGSALALTTWGRFWTEVEAALGLLLYGLLVVVLYTRFSRR